MTDPAVAPSKGGTPLWVRIVLGVSLALNLLIAGVVLGAALGKPEGGPERAGRDPGAMPFVHALEPAHRRVLLRQMRREGDQSPAEARAEMRRRMAVLLDALRAGEMDRAALETVLNDQAEDGARRQALGQKVLLDHLADMSLADRRAYADRLEEALTRRRPVR